MTTTDLKPGDLVQHAEFGPGLVGGGKQILYLARDGFVYAAVDPAGWERVETVRPGHVQVRVDDLDWADAGDRLKAADRLIIMLCDSAQPDEPTEAGAKVTSASGRRYLRIPANGGTWVDIDTGEGWSWGTVAYPGTVTIGWDE